MAPLSEKQRIATHILPNIPRSKGNQTMKFDHLMEGKNFPSKIMQKMRQ